MARLRFLLCAVAPAIGTAVPANAEVYRLATNDGTVHFTNAPTDPRYRGLGYSSGTAAGYLRLPPADTGRYVTEIKDASGRYGVPERLVQAVIRVESAFNPRAVSIRGAQGLMQFMPETASLFGGSKSFDPHRTLDARDRNLRVLLAPFGT